jgi:hypothetical protein
MRYHYQDGIDNSCGWGVFFTRMAVFDLAVILIVLIASNWYHTYQANRDEQLIRGWCQQVLCVQIDPATGIGTPAIPEPEPIKLEEA